MINDKYVNWVKRNQQSKFVLFREESCTDFTYFNFRGIQTCFLLSGCSDKKPKCTVESSCVSGIHRIQ